MKGCSFNHDMGKTTSTPGPPDRFACMKKRKRMEKKLTVLSQREEAIQCRFSKLCSGEPCGQWKSDKAQVDRHIPKICKCSSIQAERNCKSAR